MKTTKRFQKVLVANRGEIAVRIFQLIFITLLSNRSNSWLYSIVLESHSPYFNADVSILDFRSFYYFTYFKNSISYPP